MAHSNTDSQSPACWVCQFSLFLSAAILFLYILCFSVVCRYYVRMTALYSAIVLNAVIVCALWPLCFVADFSKLIFDCFRVLSAWTGVRCELRNGAVLKTEGPHIIVSNHQSSIDVVVLSQIWPSDCTVMMKKSLKYIPFFNVAAFMARAVFVDRFNRERAKQSITECAEIIKQKNLSVWMFPEGTRNHGDGMLEFKKGAFNISVLAQIPIVPVVISSYKPFYCKNSHYFHDNGFVIAEVMEPVYTTEMTLEDVPALTSKVRDEMIAVFDRISAEAATKYSKRDVVVAETADGSVVRKEK